MTEYMKGRVVHCRHAAYDTYIGRPSKWGNPFVLGKDGTREEVVAKYEVHLRNSRPLMQALVELQGKVLGCWCAPRPCHGDVLLRLLEEMERP